MAYIKYSTPLRAICQSVGFLQPTSKAIIEQRKRLRKEETVTV